MDHCIKASKTSICISGVVHNIISIAVCSFPWVCMASTVNRFYDSPVIQYAYLGSDALLHDATVILNQFFNLLSMLLTSHRNSLLDSSSIFALPDSCVQNYFLPILCGSFNCFITINGFRLWMSSLASIFSTVKNSITACCIRCIDIVGVVKSTATNKKEVDRIQRDLKCL